MGSRYVAVCWSIREDGKAPKTRQQQQLMLLASWSLGVPSNTRFPEEDEDASKEDRALPL